MCFDGIEFQGAELTLKRNVRAETLFAVIHASLIWR